MSVELGTNGYSKHMSTDIIAMAAKSPADPIARLRKRISERLIEKRMSAREASRRAGFNVGYVGDIVEGRSKAPETDKIIKIAEVLEIPTAELFEPNGSHASDSSISNNQQIPYKKENVLVPLIAVQEISDEIFLALSTEPVGMVDTIPALSMIHNAYAFTVPNNLNEPRYFAGETVYISPAAPPRPGDFVFLKCKDGTAGIAQLVRIKGSRITITVLNAPGGEKTRERASFESIHRIVGSMSYI